MITLYDNLDSGNAYKVRLLLSHLNIDFERIEIDVFAGVTRRPEFLKLNANGRVPTLKLDDGRCISESNAILYFFGRDSDYFPDDLWQQATTLQWMFFEQYSHEPYVAVARSIQHDPRADAAKKKQIPTLIERGHSALSVMEQHLSSSEWFTGDQYGIADMALYAYTHVAPDGGISLQNYPAIKHWLSQIANRPGHRTMETA